MRIRPILLVSLFLIILIIAGIPWVSGHFFKQTYLNLLAGINKQTQSQIKVLEYHEGIFSSTVKLAIDVNLKSLPLKIGPSAIIINQHIYHGPYLHDPIQGWVFGKALIKSRIHIDPKIENVLLGTNNKKGILQIDTLVSGHHYVSQVKTPFFNYSSKIAVIAWQGLSGTIDAVEENNYIASINSNWNIATLSVKDENNIFVLDSASIHSNRICNVKGFCETSGDALIPAVSTSGAMGKSEFSNLDIKISHTNNADNTIGNMSSITINQLTSPYLSLNPSYITLKMDELDKESSIKLFLISRDLESADPTQQQKLLEAYTQEVPHLITAKSIISEDLKISTEFGDIQSSGKAFWPENTPLPVNLNDIFDKASAQITIRAASSFIDHVIEKIAEYQTSGMQQSTQPTTTIQTINVPKITAADVMKQMGVLFSQKQINPQTFNMVAIGFKQNVPPFVFDRFVDQRLARNEMTQNIATAIKTQYDAVFNYRSQLIKSIFSTPTPNIQELQNKINLLNQEGLIQADVAKQIMYLASQDFSTEIFTSSLGNIGAELVSSISTAYSQTRTGATGVSSEISAIDSPEVKARKSLRNEFDSYVKQTYVIEDGDSYLINITYDKGILMLNGKPMNNMPTATVVPAPANVQIPAHPISTPVVNPPTGGMAPMIAKPVISAQPVPMPAH